MHVNHQRLEDHSQFELEWSNTVLNYNHSVPLKVVKDQMATYQRRDQSEEEQHRKCLLEDKEKALGFDHPKDIKCEQACVTLVRQGKFKKA